MESAKKERNTERRKQSATLANGEGNFTVLLQGNSCENQPKWKAGKTQVAVRKSIPTGQFSWLAPRASSRPLFVSTASSARAHRLSSLPHCISTFQDELYCSLYLPVSFLFMQLRRRPARAWIDIMADGDRCRNVDISDQPKAIEMSTLDFV